ncbi:hypothetical protein BCR44DRAFT_1061142 [Catenaria anguillulae PL171]|uniref:DNA ligase (ATP) n=1 Tax=Catenaria anguillulae PL171 TaxID=765915 RepID=A0A1Y2HQK7_9FUNG|nr:hypothetical protein BCR44DRAFT_1061142 [Catenaria anguillulae PL171]
MANPLYFSQFVKFLDALCTEKHPENKRKYCRKLLDYLRARNNADEIFVVLRMLLPLQDRTRGSYKMKELALAKSIAAALSLDPKSDQAQHLQNYRQPRAGFASHGDFSEVALDVLRNRSTVTRAVGDMGPTMADVDAKLDAMVAAQDMKEKDAIMLWFIKRFLPLELKWLLRIICKDLKLGVSERTVLGEWHPNAYRLWTTSSDLRGIAALTDQAQVLGEDQIQVQIMVPFKPMLGYKADKFNLLPGYLKSFGKPFYVQEKIDGERILIHYQRGQFRFYSRKSIEWTEYGRDFDSGSWTRHLGGPFWIDQPGMDIIEEFILDGEMVAVDSRTGEVLPFGTLRSAQVGTVDPADVSLGALATHPRFFAFDLLCLNGTPMGRVMLRDRYAKLVQLFRRVPGWFEILGIRKCSTPAEIVTELQEIYCKMGEGVVVKDPDSVYVPGERPRAWLKVKMDYETELLETMDLVVIGACWGEGRRGKMFSHFLVGLRDPSPDGDPEKDEWVSFARVGSGYSRMQLEELHSKLNDFTLEYNPTKLPTWLRHITSASRTRPDVLIHPRHSVVLEVIAAELTPSTDYAAGATLRFPRVRAIRTDKGVDDAASMADVDRIWEKTQGRLVKPPTEDLFDAKRVRASGKGAASRRGAARKVVSGFVGMAEHAAAAQSSSIRTDGQASGLSAKSRRQAKRVFHGRTFLIVGQPRPANRVLGLVVKPTSGAVASSSSDPADPTTAEGLHHLVYEHGGQCIAKLGNNSELPLHVKGQPIGIFTVIAADPKSLYLKSIIKLGKYDVLASSHLVNCVAAKRWITPKPADYLHMTPVTRLKYQDAFDPWGDHYSDKIASPVELKQVFEHMDRLAVQLAPPSTSAPQQQVSILVPSKQLFSMPFSGTDRDDALAPFHAQTVGHDKELVRDRRLKWEQIERVRARYFNDAHMPGRWFQGMVVYPHWYVTPGNPEGARRRTPEMQVAVARLVMYGAEVTSDMRGRKDQVTHYLVEGAAADVRYAVFSLDDVSRYC